MMAIIQCLIFVCAIG